MAHRPYRHVLFLSLALFVLLPFGCGDDGKSGEETFETAPNQYQEGRPQVILLDLPEDLALTTALDSVTLSGLAYDAVDLLVNDQSVELGEKRDDDLTPWEVELDLVEGENTFTVKAVNDDGLESVPSVAVVTYDPDYEPEPPENSLFPDYVPPDPFDDPFWSVEDDQYMKVTYTLKFTQGMNYDSLPASPDEMRYEGSIKEVDTDLEDTVPDLNFGGGFESGGQGHVEYIVLSRCFSCFCSGTHNVQFYIHFWEEDDGIFTGGDDEVGTATTTTELPCCSPDSGRLSHTRNMYIEGNHSDDLEVHYDLEWEQFGVMN